MSSEGFVERHSQGNRHTREFRPVGSEHQKVSPCGHEKVYKTGHDSRSSQCFRCRLPVQDWCGRTFIESTGTPLVLMRMPTGEENRAGVDCPGIRWDQVVGYRDDVWEALQDRIEEGSVLYMDGFSTYWNVARDAAVAPHVVLRKDAEPTVDQSLKGHFSLARVNAIYTQLNCFVNKQARGVSTRYIQGHLRWTQAVRKPALSECLVLNPPPREIFHT